jgi:3-deoxy-D-manno-octulosonic-acid transferase
MKKNQGRLTYSLFNSVLIGALPLVAGYVLLRWRRRVIKGLSLGTERWGRLDQARIDRFKSGRWWWVHAVSVGEVKAIHSFLKQAPDTAGVKIALSLLTPEALEWAARHKIADEIFPAPIDLPWIVRRIFKAIHPELFISVESEFWPNLLREARRSGARVALINGRISERSFRSYRRFRIFLKPLWNTLDLLAVRQPQDAERFRALGIPAEKIHVTGNLKYDLVAALPRSDHHNTPVFAKPLVVVGSSREGEENLLIPALEAARVKFPDIRIIIAPRHLERLEEVEQLLKSRGLAAQRKSVWAADLKAPYILWDSMGDLLEAYRQADISVIGGSFVPRGGQNPIEPAVFGVPVLFGPSMDNFHGIADRLIRQGGALQVSLSDLAVNLIRLLGDPAERREMGGKARAAIESGQGATKRTLDILGDLVRA